ncbi:MAG: rhomboid family intramembrane serine protease [Gemmatimonadaceae bacterium]|nr:rhomboid family intramembrane serine protease [Gemmatimonadaceae bacterium]MCW5825713.1 rhomboid family intramembrane serine protease [Gemmatimonadaceae bacterium]
MIPLSDDNPTVRVPVMTILLLTAIGSAWVIIQGAGFRLETLAMSVCNLGMVPAELTGAAPLGTSVPLTRTLLCVVDAEPVNWLSPLTSMFLHGSWAHLLGNGLFLWVFGNNVEDVMGRGRFLLFYLLCGLAAAAVHVFVQPASAVPTVGASGAISGAMGAYLVLFPRVRVRMLFIFVIFFRIIPLPAWGVLLWWFVLQLLLGLPDLAALPDSGGGVAVWAHVGGFAAGVLLVRVFQRDDLVAQRRAMLLRRGLLDAV